MPNLEPVTPFRVRRRTSATQAMNHVPHDGVFLRNRPLSRCEELACVFLGTASIAKPGVGLSSVLT